MAKSIAVADQTSTGLQQLKSYPERLNSFLTDVRSEMHKVVTPNREEVQSTTIVVIVCVFLFAAYFAVIDFVLSHSIDTLFKHLAAH